ncbi:hypothetical protein Ciccas_010635 [Cichlidogyrus casuarinus]|uniref:Uncharacterized protein n=1 Tax=Cichlidogyrus casuarinus TaxID=1844966 RepID=A0ABD2PUE9_9PLAT
MLHEALNNQAKFYWDLSDERKRRMEPFAAHFDPHNICDGQGHPIQLRMKFHGSTRKHSNESEFLRKVRQEKYNKGSNPTWSSAASHTVSQEGKSYPELRNLKLDPSLTMQERNRIKRQLIQRLENRKEKLQQERNKALSRIAKKIAMPSSNEDPIGCALSNGCHWTLFKDFYQHRFSVQEILLTRCK